MKKKWLVFIAVFHCASLFAQFGNQRIISTDTQKPYLVVPHDMDGDGWIDVITASAETFLLSWYKNLGDGNFGPEIILNEQQVYYESIEVVDLDHDGIMDVFYQKLNPSHIAWLRGIDTDGNFEEEVVLLTAPGGKHFSSVSTFDFDTDGLVDIIAILNTSTRHEIVWYRNLGGGNFDYPQQLYEARAFIQKLIFEDIDNDGMMDMLVAESDVGPGRIYWLKNMGNQTFGAPQTIFEFEESRSGWTILEEIQTGDLNGDGKRDIVLRAEELDGHNIYWMEKLDHEGNYGPLQLIKAGDESFLLCDLDNDGDLDIVLGGLWKISWQKNDGDGNFDEEIIISREVNWTLDTQVADLNNDGITDVLSASFRDNKLAWYQNGILGVPTIAENRITIFPNPVSDILYIKSEQEIDKIELFDIVGRKIADFRQESSIDFAQRSSGLYFVKVFESSGDFQLFRVMKR